MGRKRRRRRRRKKSSVKTLIKKELSKNLEKYTLLSSIKNVQIPYMFYREDDLNSPQFVYSLTGGYHRGLQGAQQTQGADSGMNSLFNLNPLGYEDGSGSMLTDAGGMGGMSNEQTLTGIPGVITNVNQTAFPGTHTLRGTECKLLNFHFRYQIDWSQLTQYSFDIYTGTPPVARQINEGLIRGTGQAVRLMVIETRRPLAANNGGATQLAQQIFLQATVAGVQPVVAGPPITSQPASINSFINYNTVKRILWSKLIHGSSIKTQTIGRGTVRLQRKAHWQNIYTLDGALHKEAIQYQGPFLYLMAWSSNYEDIVSPEEKLAGYINVTRPRISMTSMLTFNDA